METDQWADKSVGELVSDWREVCFKYRKAASETDKINFYSGLESLESELVRRLAVTSIEKQAIWNSCIWVEKLMTDVAKIEFNEWLEGSFDQMRFFA